MPGKKIPTQLKILRGTFRGDRANQNEPQPERSAPDHPPPTWLKGRAERRRWRELVETLAPAGLFTRVDMVALADLCRLQVLQETLLKTAQEAGNVAYGSTGQLVIHPGIAEARRLQAEIYKLLTHFGMTPSARGNISVPEKSEHDEMSELLGEDDG